MALIGNYSVLNKSCALFTNGTATAGAYAANTRSNWNSPTQNFARNVNSFSRNSSRPSGMNVGEAYTMSVSATNLELASFTFINGAGYLAATATLAKLSTAALSGVGSLTGSVGAVVKAASNLAGVGSITANLGILSKLNSNLSGSGSLTSAASLKAKLLANLSGAGSIVGNVKGKNAMTAAITIGGTGYLSNDDVSRLSGAVWDVDTAPHSIAGSTGKALQDAGSAGDPWGTAIPASYAEGTAGYKLGSLNNAISGSAAISTTATGFTLTTGIETNTFTDTQSANAVKHTIDDVGNVIDGYYEFFVGQNGAPVNVTAIANLQSGNDSMPVYGWNWLTSAWVQVGTLPGTNNSSLAEYNFPILSNLVGSGSDSGKVRVRFAITSGGSNPRLDIDFLYLSYSVIIKDLSAIGTAVGGSSTTIVLPSTFSVLDNYYFPRMVNITAGTGAGQSRRISDYVGATRTATVATAWVTAPDNTSEFELNPWASVRVSELDQGPIDQIWDEPMATHSASGTFGAQIKNKLLTVAKFLGLK
jgi:hypothetical protein